MTIPSDFVGSDEAHKIARCVRGCATDEQYVELLWRIDESLTRRSKFLDDEQSKKFEKWAQQFPPSKAVDGARFIYKYIPTSLGLVVKVECGITHKEIDLTDYSSW